MGHWGEDAERGCDLCSVLISILSYGSGSEETSACQWPQVEGKVLLQGVDLLDL